MFTARRLGYAVLALVAIAVAVVGVGFLSNVRFTPETHRQARAANTDALWARKPSGMHEYFRHTGLEDATWLPEVLRQTTLTIIQRAYRFDGASMTAFEQWHRAATSSGWAFAGTTCGTLSETVVKYTKMLGDWPATMAVEGNLDDHEIQIKITLPDPTEPSPSGELEVLDCRSG